MEDEKKKVCRYGTKCYRKNQNHLKQYLHKPETTTNERKSYKDDQSTSQQNRLSIGVSNAEDDATECILEPGMAVGKKRKISSPTISTTKEESDLRKKACSKNDAEYDLLQNKEQVEKAEESDESGNESEENSVKSHSWTYIKPPAKSTSASDAENQLKSKKVKDLIKEYYLVDMPSDFYSFFEFCESVCKNQPLAVLKSFGLMLVGPFELLSGQVTELTKDAIHCHWRYFYDPPEFQTVLVSDTGFHMGYWRDSPKENPVLLASNNANENCIFKVESENIFGAVYHYLTQFIKKCEPFNKMKASKFQTELSTWADKNKLTLDKITPRIKSRQRKINSKTFHTMGIVVPVNKKTEVGYRPLIESDAKIKKICTLIIESNGSTEQERLMEKLQPLITAANIANDECDFGNGLELGIDLFCMGSHVFHDKIEYLLTTAYSLLNRSEFGQITKCHLKNRRKGNHMSITDQKHI